MQYIFDWLIIRTSFFRQIILGHVSQISLRHATCTPVQHEAGSEHPLRPMQRNSAGTMAQVHYQTAYLSNTAIAVVRVFLRNRHWNKKVQHVGGC
jgi:hypothetical protein